ncbi:MAG: NTP transferase domain-containing protein [Actinomycetota bacterium]
MNQPAVLVPIRSFTGMTRLSETLDSDERSRLSRILASRLLTAIATAGLQTTVITASDEVATWARQQSAAVCEDQGGGLTGAVHAGVSMVGSSPWLVVHADLPLVTAHAIAAVAEACRSTTVIAPSYDGGTAVIGGRGSFPFSYGVGSFQRHYASAPNATVIISPEFGIDIDTERGLELVPELLRKR